MVDRSEAAILNDALIAGSAEPETMVWRENSGVLWAGTPLNVSVGQTITIKPGMKVLQNGRPVRAGVPGIGDIMGVSAGRAVAGEAKTLTGQLRVTQINFGRAFTKAGGLYLPFRSPEEFVAGLRSARR